ncbi:MAG: tetratricopeptide repeat protein, partial [Archaeoglobaceae archaeon]|nr:tetratricopeptide repeat protein [Archaeoglobaceae archaeon]
MNDKRENFKFWLNDLLEGLITPKEFLEVVYALFSDIPEGKFVIEALSGKVKLEDYDDLLKFDLFNANIAKAIEYFDLDLALELHKRNLEFFRKLDDKEGIATALHNIGMIYQLRGEYDLALKCYNEALEIGREIKDKEGIAGTLNNIGVIYKDRGEYDLALKYYNEVLQIFREIGYKEGIA